MIGGVQEEASRAPVIGLIDQDGGRYSRALSSYIGGVAEVVYNGTSVEEGLRTVRAEGGTALLAIEPDFTADMVSGVPGTVRVYWIMMGAGVMDSVSSSVVDSILAGANQHLSATMIEEGSSTNSTLILNPWSGRRPPTLKRRSWTTSPL
jgi:ABC-2 type transport system permease protein